MTFLHCKIKPISNDQFSEMGIGQKTAAYLRTEPILGVKERRVQKPNPELNIRGGTLVYLCGGELGTDPWLWVWEEYVEYQGGYQNESKSKSNSINEPTDLALR